jgi:hypothetical protein
VSVEVAAPEWGGVKVRIFGTERALQVQVRSPDAGARDSLKSGVQDLIRGVEQLGVRAERVFSGDGRGTVNESAALDVIPSQAHGSTAGAEPIHSGAELAHREPGGQSGPDWEEARRKHQQLRRRK